MKQQAPSRRPKDAPLPVESMPTSERPGTEAKIEVLSLRWAAGVDLFNENDVDFASTPVGRAAGDHETELDADFEDDSAAVQAVTDAVNDLLAGIRTRTATVSSEVCETSQDRSKPGCSGGCEWCRTERRTSGKIVTKRGQKGG